MTSAKVARERVSRSRSPVCGSRISAVPGVRSSRSATARTSRAKSGNAAAQAASARQSSATPASAALRAPRVRPRLHVAGRHHPLQHGAAHAARIGAHVHQRRPRAVRATPQVQLLVAQRRAHRLRVVRQLQVPVAREVRAARQLFAAARGGRRRKVAAQVRLRVCRVAQLALQRRRAAGAALVHEQQVAPVPQRRELFRQPSPCPWPPVPARRRTR